jgi:hypothetical protein
MVSQLLSQQTIPETSQQPDFGGVIEDMNQTALLESPPSQYDFRKSVKVMRAAVRYSVGIHGTVNKSLPPVFAHLSSSDTELSFLL